MTYKELRQLVTRWQEDIQRILSITDQQGLYNLEFHFLTINSKKHMLSVILYFYLNYLLDLRDPTEKELNDAFDYFIKEVKDELTKEELAGIKTRRKYLFETFYNKKPENIEPEKPPFEVD